MSETSQPTTDSSIKRIHFFVSRTGADAAWAQWIAWQLEANDYRVVIQDWDFGPGVNFVHKMQQASTDAERTIAVLSPRYFQSSFTEAEWTASFYRDATGEEGRLLPIRIESFTPPGMFGPLNCLDLFDLDPDAARQCLLNWIGRAGKQRVKPGQEPVFPGPLKTRKSGTKLEPNFPGRMPPNFRLPERNRNFTGREALLDEVRNQLAGGRAAALTSATRQVATHGLGLLADHLAAGRAPADPRRRFRRAGRGFGAVQRQRAHRAGGGNRGRPQAPRKESRMAADLRQRNRTAGG